SDGQLHRTMPMGQWQGMFQFQRGQFTAESVAGQSPEAMRDAKVQSLLQKHQQAAAATRLEIQNLARSGHTDFASDMIPVEDFRSALETVLARIGKEALPVLERSTKDSNHEV